MNAWLNANYPHLIAFAGGFAIRWAALMFMSVATAPSKGGSKGGQGDSRGPAGGPGGKAGRWNKNRFIKFVTLFFVVIGGLVLAYGAYPLAQWVVGWGGTLGGIASVIFGVVTLWAGWHSLHGLIALVHDMVDGTPDDEAFSAGFWVPTTIPLGWAALAGLFMNPRGVATGLACVAVSLVTAIYAHKILKKTHNAQGHYGAWMYLSTIICIFVGIAHIPALIYLNDFLGNHLPEWAGWLIRSVMVIAGIVFFVAGLGDWFRDRIPEKWSQWAAMYTTPTFVVLGVSLATLQADASTSLTRIFGAF